MIFEVFVWSDKTGPSSLYIKKTQSRRYLSLIFGRLSYNRLRKDSPLLSWYSNYATWLHYHPYIRKQLSQIDITFIYNTIEFALYLLLDHRQQILIFTFALKEIENL